jgi:general secretion pathway protein G
MTNMGVRTTKGFGLLDLMLTLIISSLLVALAIPVYGQYAERARVGKAVGDIGAISILIESFRLRNNDRIPNTLDELVGTVPLDPWGNEYRFLNMSTAGPGKGAFRKDGKLNPLNTDFDLYSLGADEDSKGPLNAKASRDDIVRANNGAFIGLGEEY